MKKNHTLKSIVNQFEKVGYESKDGLHALELNTAFIELKKRADSLSIDKGGEWYIGREMYVDGIKMYVSAIAFKRNHRESIVRPTEFISQVDSQLQQRDSVVNKWDKLQTPEEFKNEEIKKAKDILKKYGEF